MLTVLHNIYGRASLFALFAFIATFRKGVLDLRDDRRGIMGGIGGPGMGMALAGVVTTVGSVIILIVTINFGGLVVDSVGSLLQSLGANTYSSLDHSQSISIGQMFPMLFYVGVIILSIGGVGLGGFMAYKGVKSSFM